MKDRFHRTLIFCCYFFGLIFSAAILLVERRSRDLQYHACQALLLHGLFLLGYVPVACLATFLLLHQFRGWGFALMGLSAFLVFLFAVIWISAIVQVVRGKNPRIPLITAWAQRAIHID